MRQKQKMWVNFGFGTFFILFYGFVIFALSWTIDKGLFGKVFIYAEEHPTAFLCMGLICFILMAIFFCLIRMIFKRIYSIRNH